MSIHFTGRGARRGLAVLTTAAVVCGLAAGVPSATAATKKKDRAIATSIAPKASTLSAGRYVVLLNDPGATRYDGGVAGLKATASPNGRSFDAQTAKVADYQAYLTKRQNGVAAAVGAEVMSRSTLVRQLVHRTPHQQAGHRPVPVARRPAWSSRTRPSASTPTSHPSSSAWRASDGAPGVWDTTGGVATAGAGTVVGIFDSGIWPESASFAGSKIDREPDGAVRPSTARATRSTCRRRTAASSAASASRARSGTSTTATARSSAPATTPTPSSTACRRRSGSAPSSSRPVTATATARTPPAPRPATTASDASVEGRDFGKVSGMARPPRSPPTRSAASDTDPNTGGCYTSSTRRRDRRRRSPTASTSSTTRSPGATDTVVDAVEIAFLGAAAAGIFVAASAGNSGPDAPRRSPTTARG